MINKNDFIEDSGVCGIQNETLELASCALELDDVSTVLDMGTGTGYIGIVLSKNGYIVDAIDNDEKSLQNANKNAEKLASNVKIYKSNLFSSVEKKYDLIIFNPPVNPRENRFTKIISSFLRKNKFFREVLIPIIRQKYSRVRNKFIYDFLCKSEMFLADDGKVLMHLTSDDVRWLENSAINYQFFEKKKLSVDESIVLFKK